MKAQMFIFRCPNKIWGKFLFTLNSIYITHFALLTEKYVRLLNYKETGKMFTACMIGLCLLLCNSSSLNSQLLNNCSVQRVKVTEKQAMAPAFKYV